MYIFFLTIALAGCAGKSGEKEGNDSSATTTAQTADVPIMEFEKASYDFGLINEGEKVAHSFKFTNKGKTPLIISNAIASCGCTVPSYPKEPIAPGKGGVIDVVFNSAGKMGKMTKVVTITSNSMSANSELYMIGEVKEVPVKK